MECERVRRGATGAKNPESDQLRGTTRTEDSLDSGRNGARGWSKLGANGREGVREGAMGVEPDDKRPIGGPNRRARIGAFKWVRWSELGPIGVR